MMLRLDHEYVSGGYSWIFHTGEDTAKVGLCYIQNEQYQRHSSKDLTVDEYFEHWLDTDPRFEDAERFENEHHRGSAHIQKAPGSMSTDSFVAVGDSVPSLDPLWGEGIHKCMKSGRAAAVTADRCLTGGIDTSAEEMAVYDDLWRDRVASLQKRRTMMTKLLYLADNDRYDTLMCDLNQTGRGTLSEINQGNIWEITKLLYLSDLPLLGKYLWRNVDANLF